MICRNPLRTVTKILDPHSLANVKIMDFGCGDAIVGLEHVLPDNKRNWVQSSRPTKSEQGVTPVVES